MSESASQLPMPIAMMPPGMFWVRPGEICTREEAVAFNTGELSIEQSLEVQRKLAAARDRLFAAEVNARWPMVAS